MALQAFTHRKYGMTDHAKPVWNRAPKNQSRRGKSITIYDYRKSGDGHATRRCGEPAPTHSEWPRRRDIFQSISAVLPAGTRTGTLAGMDDTLVKVLVVDDDPALRQLLADYLNRHGYDTLLAPDASDLAARIQRYSPDLIVLDRMLPDGDGAQACRQLRQQGEDIPVIFLTARETGREAGRVRVSHHV